MSLFYLLHSMIVLHIQLTRSTISNNEHLTLIMNQFKPHCKSSQNRSIRKQPDLIKKPWKENCSSLYLKVLLLSQQPPDRTNFQPSTSRCSPAHEMRLWSCDPQIVVWNLCQGTTRQRAAGRVTDPSVWQIRFRALPREMLHRCDHCLSEITQPCGRCTTRVYVWGGRACSTTFD